MSVETLLSLLKGAEEAYTKLKEARPTPQVFGEALKRHMGIVRCRNMLSGAVYDDADEFAQNPEDTPIGTNTGTLTESENRDF